MSEPGNGPFNNRRYYPNFGRKTMPEAIRERNEAVAEGRRYVNDQKAANDAREQFITYVEKAAARNKHIDLQVYRDIIAAYDAEYTQYIALVEAGKKDPEMAAQAQEARNTMVSRVNKRIEKHGAMGEEAMRTIANEKQPESFFTPIVRQVYDSDKGGLQVGGILGALLGGAGAYFAGGQFGLGTLFKLGLTAGGVALGTYLGNKVLPSEDTLKVTSLRTPMPKTPSPAKVRTPDMGGPGETVVRTDPDSLRTALGTTTVAKTDIKPAGLTGDEKRQFSPTGSPTPAGGKELT